MDAINLLRLGQVIQQEMLERATLDQWEWEPHPWRRRVGALLMNLGHTLTRAGNAMLQQDGAPLPITVEVCSCDGQPQRRRT